MMAAVTIPGGAGHSGAREQAIRQDRGGGRRQPPDRAGLAGHAARAVGLREDDDPADGRGSRNDDQRPGLHRRRGGHPPAAQRPGRHHDVPVLRAVPAPQRVRECGVRPARVAAVGGRRAEGGRGRSGAGRHGRHGGAAPERPLGRPAAARGAGPVPGHAAQGAALRRAAVQPGRQAPEADAGGDPAACSSGWESRRST